jgi:hypothetical protein
MSDSEDETKQAPNPVVPPEMLGNAPSDACFGDDVLDDGDLKKRDMFFETRLSEAESRRQKGNDMMKNGDLQSALKLYKQGLYYGEFDEVQFNFELMDNHRFAWCLFY